MVTSSAGTVIDILTAVIPSPAIHAHALVAAVGVVARAAILAGVRHQLALIDILSTKLTCGRTGRQGYLKPLKALAFALKRSCTNL